MPKIYKKRTFCHWCKKIDHVRITSLKCPQNEKNVKSNIQTKNNNPIEVSNNTIESLESIKYDKDKVVQSINNNLINKDNNTGIVNIFGNKQSILPNDLQEHLAVIETFDSGSPSNTTSNDNKRPITEILNSTQPLITILNENKHAVTETLDNEQPTKIAKTNTTVNNEINTITIRKIDEHSI